MSKCGCKGKCSCGSSEAKTIAQLQNKLGELENIVTKLYNEAKFLMGGHPILMLDQEDDIGLFDSDGLGTEKWAGWALCNGDTYKDYNGKDLESPNLIDRFVVGAGDTYEVGDTGGEAFHTLTVAEMPEHAHTVTDEGHTHVVTDPGHVHAINQTPHSHGGSVASHNHGVDLTTQQDGAHNHETGYTIIGDANGGTNFNARNDGTSGVATSDHNGHTHAVTGSTENASPGLTIDDASVDIDVVEAFTGITVEEAVTGIVINNAGEGEQHENRPPYYALVFVIKL